MFNRETLNLTGGILAVLLTLVLGFVLWALIYVEVPDKNQNALLVVLGVLSTNVTTIISFFFGSSATNKKQADTIDTLASTANTTANTAATIAGAQPSTMNVAPGDTVKVKGVEDTGA